METKKTYYYNVLGGVTPADHNVHYDRDELVTDADLGNYRRGVARLEIENPKSFNEYLENVSGHYVEGVNSWQTAHEYLVDLLQAMMVELVKGTGMERPKEYTAIINESYADGTYIDYCMYYYPEDGRLQISIDASKSIEGNVLNGEALQQMLSFRGEDLLG